MVLNYYKLDDIVNGCVINKVDHLHLNNVFMDILPTAENLVVEIWDMLDSGLAQYAPDREVTLWEVMLQETPRSFARMIRPLE